MSQGAEDNGDSVEITDESYGGSSEVYHVSVTPEQEPSTRAERSDKQNDTPPGNEWEIQVPALGNNTEASLSRERDLVRSSAAYGVYDRWIYWDFFIPQTQVPAPVLCNETLPEFTDKYYGGDSRSFGANLDGYRWEGDSRVQLVSRFDFGSPVFSYSPQWGWSFVNWTEPVAESMERIGESRIYEEQADGSMQVIETSRASKDDVEAGAGLQSSTTGNASFQSSAADPLCHILWGIDAPEVDVDVSATVSTDGSHHISGSHDNAPHHQSFIQTKSGPISGDTIADPPTYADYEASSQVEFDCAYRHTGGSLEKLALPSIALSPDPRPWEPDCSTPTNS
ncbi:DUF3238 domain-containing protein [Streptomonospora algeriensis]|uniref:DUF3238 domain-containing protein n=1 Tax=Streptomonospora algeriensis TaxID=995084 RepID=A0ABW3BBH4_9ACTN